ncbi:MAG: hypothetical protein RLZZ610_928 [Actinomycetota bacterium]|jgi:hypothetical protein
MSKKLIAVASAAALALTALVGVAPASANVTVTYALANNAGADASVSVGTSLNTTAAGTTVALLDVPSNNSLQYSSTTGRQSLAKATVTVPAAGTVVNVTTTGKVRVIEEPTDTTNKYNSTSGVTSWTKTSTTTSVVFYFYTTGTDKGSVKIATGGNSTEVFLFGKPGPAFRLGVTLPSTVGTVAPTNDNVFASVVDLFGNNVTNATITQAATSGATLSTLTWDATDLRYEAKLHNATAGQFAVTASIADPTDVTGFTEVISFFGTVNSQDAAAQVVTLTAQVAALTAQLAASVTKAKYNKLARKWNRANPSNKVKLAK